MNLGSNRSILRSRAFDWVTVLVFLDLDTFT